MVNIQFKWRTKDVKIGIQLQREAVMEAIWHALQVELSFSHP